MTFAWPLLLWLLVLPTALLVWELLRAGSHEAVAHPKIVRAEAGLTGVSLSSQKPSVFASSRRRIFLCVGLAFGVAALARPQWGHLEEPVLDPSREVLIALDLSRSMLSQDVKPSRLERSKLLVESLLDHLQGERVGLIVFSGTAFLQSPPSPDYEILRDFLPSLNPDFMPEGGTNYRDLLDTAVDAFGDDSSADRYLIILSDGEATDDDWKPRVSVLAKHGIRVIGLGVGTEKGAMIPDGAGAFMKDDSGAVVLSKLEPGTLRQLAGATRGTYRDASEWVDLSALLQATVSAGHRGSFVDRRTVRYIERYQWALAPALACLLASLCLEFPVQPKPRQIRLGAPVEAAKGAASALAGAALLLLAVAAVRSAAADSPPPDPAAVLSRTVGRLAAQDSYSAYDWADLAHATIDWGSDLQAKKEEIPGRPITDALTAVDRGSAADPKAADWAHLRSELEDLRQHAKQPPPEPTPSPTPPPKQQQDKQSNAQQNPQSQSNPSGGDRPTQPPDSNPNSGAQAQPPPESAQPQPNTRSEANGQSGPKVSLPQSAFGDMNAPTPQPPKQPERALQAVGGAKKDAPDDPARKNPELAVPLEKLEQVKNQDSPERLFELLRKGEPITPTPNKGPNW